MLKVEIFSAVLDPSSGTRIRVYIGFLRSALIFLVVIAQSLCQVIATTSPRL